MRGGIAGAVGEYIEAQNEPCARRTVPSADPKQNRALALDPEEPHPAGNYFLPGDLESQIEAFIEHYNYERYHESLSSVTPSGAYFGRAVAIIKQRERVKRQTIEHRHLQHRRLAA